MASEKKLFRKGPVRVEREVERYETTVWRNRYLRKESRHSHRLAVPKPEQNEIVVKRNGHYELAEVRL